MLVLDDNQLGSWGEVMRLAHLPALRKLSLSGNPIPSISLHAAPRPGPAAGGHGAARGAQGAVGVGAAQGGEAHAEAGSTASAGAAGDPAAAFCFGHLQALYLANCRLAVWSDVDALDAGLPGLKELRLSGNPLLATAKGGGRYEVGLLPWLCGVWV